MKNEIIVIFFVLLINIVSAKGLIVINNNFNINKSYNNDSFITFTLKNTENFPFYNISFEDNNIIYMSKINKLNPGAIANVTAVVNSNENFDGSVRIVGVYYSNLGLVNETHNVYINYDIGLDPCDISIVKGDSINFTNNAGRDVKLIKSSTNEELLSIDDGKSVIKTFNIPSTLTYYASWFGFKFSDDCNINVLNDVGYIHNPLYDGILNISININYPETTLTTTFLKTHHIIEAFDKDSEIFLIKNNGNNIAKNIKLDGKWLTFSQNNFDLNKNTSKTLTYTITPNIKYTNQTNKTYYINLTIKGNFPTIIQRLSVFIPYADIDNGDLGSERSLLDIIEEFCKNNPEVCGGKTKVIYKQSNTSLVNVTIASNQLKQIFEYIYSKYEDDNEFQKYVKKNLYNFNSTISQINQSSMKVVNEVDELKKSFNNSNTFLLFLILIVNFLAILGAGGYIIYNLYLRKKAIKLRRM